jgi:hypothetical protein
MSAPKGKSYDETSRNKDNIRRGIKEPSPIGTACFVGSRALDPFLQYGILAKGFGSNAIEKLGGKVLPQGPALITNTPLDSLLGLSPYRSIIFGMSVGSMLKQNIHCTTIMQEQMPPQFGLAVGAFNAFFNSLNSLFFVCAQTSASTNGEHFPQTPLIVGSSLYVIGMALEFGSEIQRHAFKKDKKNKGQVYEGGLFGLSRHINYFGGIPVLQHYLEERVSRQSKLLYVLLLTVCSTVRSMSTTRPLCHTSLCRSYIESPAISGCRVDSRCDCCVTALRDLCKYPYPPLHVLFNFHAAASDNVSASR